MLARLWPARAARACTTGQANACSHRPGRPRQCMHAQPWPARPVHSWTARPARTCMDVCCLHVCACIHVVMCVCRSVCTYVHTYVRMYVCIYVCICVYVCVHACMYVCMSACLYVCTRMRVCMYQAGRLWIVRGCVSVCVYTAGM